MNEKKLTKSDILDILCSLGIISPVYFLTTICSDDSYTADYFLLENFLRKCPMAVNDCKDIFPREVFKNVVDGSQKLKLYLK